MQFGTEPVKAIIAEWLETENLHRVLILTCGILLAAYIYGKGNRIWKNVPPGPMGLPIVGYVPFLGPEPHRTFAKLAEKYGSIFSVYIGNQHTVVIHDHETIKEAISHSASLGKRPYLFDHVTGHKGFASSSGPQWEEQRRFCIHAMRNLGLGRGPWQDLLQEEINSCLEEIAESKGQPVDVSSVISTSLTNNIVSLLIGRRLDKNSERDKIKLFTDYSDEVLKFLNPVDYITLYPKLRVIYRLFGINGYHRLPIIVNTMHVFLTDEFNKHKSSASTKEQKDFIDLYLEQMKKMNDMVDKPKHYFDEAELEANVVFLFLGGRDTLTNSLLWLLPLMAAHPEVQKKIQDELDSVFGRDGKISYDSRTLAPYTLATILEVERFASLVPLNAPRRVFEDFKIKGYTIPKGSEILSNLWFIHNDPKHWTDPEKFLPERFLSDDGKKTLKAPSYLPFSIGKRNCPGETVAMMALFIYFASMIRKYRITALPNKKVTFDVNVGLLSQIGSQKLCFQERD